jgi:aminoglycoside phosphotransferase (APT) family kinase protein
MALANRNPEEIREDLRSWLERHLDDAHDVAITAIDVPAASGMSNLTVLFGASWTTPEGPGVGEFVARVAPAGPAIFPSCDLNREAAVMNALSAAGQPVPLVRWVENDATVLGSPFLVMERAYGKVPADDPPFTVAGWVQDLTDDERYRMCVSSLEAMASIHDFDWRGAGLGFLAPSEGASLFARDLATWRHFYDWARAGETNPTVEAGLAWMVEHRPSDDREPVLNWDRQRDVRR